MSWWVRAPCLRARRTIPLGDHQHVATMVEVVQGGTSPRMSRFSGFEMHFLKCSPSGPIPLSKWMNFALLLRSTYAIATSDSPPDPHETPATPLRSDVLGLSR